MDDTPSQSGPDQPPATTPPASTPPTQPAPGAWAPPPSPPKPGPAPGVEYAGFWVRFLAYIVDAIPFIIVSAVVVVGPLMGGMYNAMLDLPTPPYGADYYSPEYQAWQAAWLERMNVLMSDITPRFWLLQVFPVVYFIGFWTWLGRTPGLMLFGLRVAKEADGTPPGFARSVLRYVGYVLSWIALFIGFIWVAFDSRKQGWHDKIAGTFVVRQSG